MNKKQLLEAVELVRATHTPDELCTLATNKFVERGMVPCGPDRPIEDHIINIACHGSHPYALWRALAAHHPNRFARWWYKQKHYHYMPLLIPLAMFWVVITLFGAPVVILALK